MLGEACLLHERLAGEIEKTPVAPGLGAQQREQALPRQRRALGDAPDGEIESPESPVFPPVQPVGMCAQPAARTGPAAGVFLKAPFPQQLAPLRFAAAASGAQRRFGVAPAEEGDLRQDG